MGQSAVTDRPLSGLRVIDLTDGKAEMCGRYLADLGAEVIMVEPPGGARSRSLPPFAGQHSLYFATHNANKRSVVLDLHADGDKQRFLDLVASSDIVVDSAKPGAMGELGLGPETLRARRQDLIVLSISDFGQTGPYRDYRGSNAVFYALGGVLARSGIDGNRPLLPPGDLALESTAIQATWVALLAYWRKLKTGAGNTMDFSLFEAMAQILDPGLGVTGSAAAGRSASEMAPYGRPPKGFLYPIFPCADGHVRICILNPRQWQGMCGWLGDDHPFTDPEYGNINKRFKVIKEINVLIAKLFADKNGEELVQEGQRRGIPIAAVSTPQQVLSNAHFNARGAFSDVEVDGVTGKVPAGYVEVDGERMGIRHPAPELGADTEAVLSSLSPRPVASAAGADGPPLAGLRVLDLGVIVAGAEAGRLFADQGADVIKVENSAFPDGLRQTNGKVAISQSFSQGSRNKRSLGLNLRDPQGIAIFKDLARDADVVLSNFKPGTMESLGIGYDTLSELNPGIVLLESSALGNTGPLAKSMGYGPLVRASSGLTGLWCYPEQAGSYSDSITIFPDHFAARVADTAILAALIRRERTGRGGKVVISQAESILTALSTPILRESLEPGSLRPLGNELEFDAPGGVFPCAGDDMWCVIELRGDADWQQLCRVMNRDDLAQSERYASAAGRIEHRETIEAAVGEWTATREAEEVMAALQSVGIAAGQMLRISDFDSNSHLQERGFFRYFDQPGFPVRLQTENGPVSVSEFPDPEIKPAPLQGQHTREIARQLLRLSEAEIDALIEQGVLEPMKESQHIVR